MELSNNNLLLSLRQDLKMLNGVSKEISQKIKTFDLNSWLFPTKSCEVVLQMTIDKRPNENDYLSLLEYIIDRLYLILNLIMKYLDELSNVPKERLPRNVVRPQNLSLGSTTNLLWRKVLDLNELVKMSCIKSVFNENFGFTTTASTQTHIYRTDTCDSCHIIISCINELINQLELTESCLHIKKIKKELREEIFNITQLGCVNRLTQAILEDIKTILVKIQDLKEQNKQSNSNLNLLALKYSNSSKQMKQVESHLKKIEKSSKNFKIKNKKLKKMSQELIQITNENECTLLREKLRIQTFEKAMVESTTSLALLSTDNEKLQGEIREALSQKIDATQEKDMWKRRFTETYLENRNLKGKLEETNGNVEELKMVMNKINRNCSELTSKLQREYFKMKEKSQGFEKLIKSTLTNNVNGIIQKKSEKTTSRYNTLDVIGDPIADMKKQVEINTSKIDSITQHNKELLRTIRRLEAMNLSN